MNDPQAAPKAERTAQPAESGTLVSTLRHLWPYIWPADHADLKLRVIGSLFLLLLAKLATVAVPFTFWPEPGNVMTVGPE